MSSRFRSIQKQLEDRDNSFMDKFRVYDQGLFREYRLRDTSDQARALGYKHVEDQPRVNEEDLFDAREIETGQATELRRVRTPKQGEQFDTIKMLVDAVLVVNRLVETIEELQNKVEQLETQLQFKGKGAEQINEETFALPALSDSYSDVKKTD